MRRRSAHLLLAATATLAGAGYARAQATDEEGPVIVGERRQQWKGFDLQRLQAAIELWGEQRRDTLKTDGQPTVETTEKTLREILELTGQAFVGHRNLLDVTGSIRFQLEDRWLDTDATTDSGRDSDFDTLFDLNGRMFGASRVPVDLFARRNELRLDRAFGSTITNTLWNYGASAMIQSQVAPTTIRLEHNDSDQNDQLGQFNYGFTSNTFSIQSNIRVSEQNRLEALYTFDDISERQEGFPDNAYQRHDLSLTDTHQFGDTRQHELRSFLRYYQQTGAFGLESIRLDEQLRLTHSRTLETRYNATAERLSQGGIDQDIFRGNASIQHRLFESLVSTGRAGGEFLSTSNGFDSNEAFVSGSLDYTKKVPMGRLNAAAALGFTAEHNGEQGSTLTVLDETHVYNDPFPITISRRNIAAVTQVTGAGGLPTYQEGFDYTVQYFPDRAEIRPILGRGIADGQVVLVDYDIGPEPASDIDSIVTSFNIRYTITEGVLRGLSPYAAYRTRDYSLTAADPSLFTLDDAQVLIAGVDYARAGLTLKTEFENHASTINPYDTWRFQALYDIRLGPASTIGIDGTYELTDYSDPANHLTYLRLSTVWQQQLTRAWDFNLRLDYRNEEDDRNGNSEGIDSFFRIQFRKRQTSAYAAVRYTIVESGPSETTTEGFDVGFRREF